MGEVIHPEFGVEAPLRGIPIQGVSLPADEPMGQYGYVGYRCTWVAVGPKYGALRICHRCGTKRLFLTDTRPVVPTSWRCHGCGWDICEGGDG